MSQRKIPESSFQNSMTNKMINQKEMSNKTNTVTHHGKIKIKMERWLDPMTWLDLEWGTASRLCVSHSESIGELGWVVLKMSVKSSEGWNLMCWSMMLHNQSWCSISFIPHYSFLLSFPPLVSPCISHLPSQSPILHPLGPLNEFRKMSPPQPHQTPYSSESW